MTATVPQSTAAALVCCLVSLLGTAVPGQVQADQRENASDSTVPAAADSSVAEVRHHHYAILGRVSRPGTYVSVHDDVTLAELVAAAGGTSQTVRVAQVIRRGHAGPRLNCSPPSTAALRPGDLIVLEQSVAESVSPAPQSVGVALVGIHSDKPVVLPLLPQLATVERLIAALRQRPTLSDSVRVLRIARQVQHLGDESTAGLIDGDVVIFDPTTLDRAALADAEPFPPPVLIPQRENVTRPPMVIQPQREVAVPVATGSAAITTPVGHIEPAGPLQTSQELADDVWPLTRAPSGSFEQPALQPQPLQAMVSSPLFAERQPFATTEQPEIVDVEAVGSAAAAAEQSQRQTVSTSVACPPHEFDAEMGDSGAVGRAEEPAGHNRPFESQQIALAGNLFQQRDAQPSASPAPAGLGRPVSGPRNSTRPPANATPAADSPTFGRRAMTVGMTVLATALMCFAVSLLWSRLDDSTGLPQPTQHAGDERSPVHAQSARRSTLDRLINNTFPIIEEPTLLPDRADFHGEAVGRERLRIDPEQALSGPHFAVPRRTPQRADLSAAKEDTRLKRETSPAGTTSGEGIASSQSRHAKQGGLLDRVLLAMERERKR